MNEPSIAVRGLRKRFGSTVALDGVSFTVSPGEVTGFVGPNGAGKSTTMRVILGLDSVEAGTALIGGRPYRSLRHPLRRVGALLDAGALHPSRSARNHLLWLAHSQGLPARRVDEVLDDAGLGGVARRAAGGFSLGMRQRLGLAAALLGCWCSSSITARSNTTTGGSSTRLARSATACCCGSATSPTSTRWRHALGSSPRRLYDRSTGTRPRARATVQDIARSGSRIPTGIRRRRQRRRRGVRAEKTQRVGGDDARHAGRLGHVAPGFGVPPIAAGVATPSRAVRAAGEISSHPAAGRYGTRAPSSGRSDRPGGPRRGSYCGVPSQGPID
jgi:ABC-type transport system involved in cytochrome c biogenesis ATPase subunit